MPHQEQTTEQREESEMNNKTWLGSIAQIKQWRIQHNISQKALATAAGVSRNTYASWERRNTVLCGTDCIKLNKVIFAWGENDYITNTNIQTEQPAEPEHKTKKKKSLLWYIGYYIGKSIRFVLRTLCIIK